MFKTRPSRARPRSAWSRHSSTGRQARPSAEPLAAHSDFFVGDGRTVVGGHDLRHERQLGVPGRPWHGISASFPATPLPGMGLRFCSLVGLMLRGGSAWRGMLTTAYGGLGSAMAPRSVSGKGSTMAPWFPSSPWTCSAPWDGRASGDVAVRVNMARLLDGHGPPSLAFALAMHHAMHHPGAGAGGIARGCGGAMPIYGTGGP